MSEEEPREIPIRKIVTSCRDCVFAAYQGDTNVDCTLGRIDKFEAAGATVTGVDDGTKKYLTIDRFCNMCHAPGSPYLEGVPPHEWASHVRDHVRARCAAIVYCDAHAGYEDLKYTIGSILAGELAPVRLIVVLGEGSGLKAPGAVRVVRNAGLPDDLDWQVVAMEPADAVMRQVYPSDYQRAYDDAVARLDPDAITYYAMVAARSELPDVLGRLDRAANDEMIPVAAVTRDGEPFVVQTKLHNHPQVMGNRGVPIAEKLPWVVETYGSGFRVLSIEELPA